jgi:hypothetical protein
MCDRFNRSFQVAIDKEIFLTVDLADKLNSLSDARTAKERV